VYGRKNLQWNGLWVGHVSHIKTENKAMVVTRTGQREVKKSAFLRMWSKVSLLLEKFEYFQDADNTPFLCCPWTFF
jgi:hypothetical protein